MTARLVRMSLFVLVIAALAIVPLVSAQEGPQAVGLRFDAPPYALHGPYWVGTTEFVIEDEVRPIPVTVWYPALNPENTEEIVVYNPIVKWTPLPEGDYPVSGHAISGAAPNAADAPYPLVVFSHGFSGFPALYAYLLEHLASYGFVVVAPNHGEFFYFDEDPWRDIPQNSIDRPREILKVIDFAENLTDSSDTFAGLINIEQVAVAGHSYGGYTTLAMAGARYDLEAYNAVCAEAADNPELAGILCETIVPHEEEMRQLAGLDSMPEGLWPSWGDPRVKAIIPMAGDAYLFEEAGLAEITLPMLALGGNVDESTPYLWGARLAYDYASSSQKALVTIESGNHFLFQTECDDIPWLLDMGIFYFCSDSVWDIDRAHDLINHFTTAFLLSVLKGDTDATAALAPDAVAFPGITYEATGF